jgi:ketopantoate reductase
VDGLPRFSLGEVDGSTTPRIQAISTSLTKAGFKAPIVNDLRAEIWLKSVGISKALWACQGRREAGIGG